MLGKLPEALPPRWWESLWPSAGLTPAQTVAASLSAKVALTLADSVWLPNAQLRVLNPIVEAKRRGGRTLLPTQAAPRLAPQVDAMGLSSSGYSGTHAPLVHGACAVHLGIG